MSPNLLSLPTLAPECKDAERRSLVKINELLYDYVYGSAGGGAGSIPSTLQQLIQAVKGCDIVLATSGAFVATFTPFPIPCVCWQIDVFSIAPSTRWVFVTDFNAYQPSQFPYYIAPVYSNCSTSMQIMAPFQRGVTVALSTAPNFPCVCDTNPNMLVTATRRTCP